MSHFLKKDNNHVVNGLKLKIQNQKLCGKNTPSVGKWNPTAGFLISPRLFPTLLLLSSKTLGKTASNLDMNSRVNWFVFLALVLIPKVNQQDSLIVHSTILHMLGTTYFIGGRNHLVLPKLYSLHSSLHRGTKEKPIVCSSFLIASP